MGFKMKSIKRAGEENSDLYIYSCLQLHSVTAVERNVSVSVLKCLVFLL